MLQRVLAIIVCVFCFTGCGGLDPISPLIQIGVYYAEGEANKYYFADQETVHKAVIEALKELDIQPIKKDEKDDNGKYYIRAGEMGFKGNEDRFKIKVVSQNSKVSKISVRVNVFGDKPLAELIFKHVDKKLADFKSVDELKKALK